MIQFSSLSLFPSFFLQRINTALRYGFRYQGLGSPPAFRGTNELVDFGHVGQTNSSILDTFMSLHALTEFDRRGHKSVVWDWQSCPGSFSGRRARDVKWSSMARPRSRGLNGFRDNDIAASIKIHINRFMMRPHFLLF